RLLVGIAGRLLRRPVLWHMRDLVPEGRVRTLFRAAAGCLPHRIICNSEAVAAQFAGSRAAARTRVIHNAVDLDHFRPARAAAEVRAELGWSMVDGSWLMVDGNERALGYSTLTMNHNTLNTHSS